MAEIFNEDEFYKYGGTPTESFKYCKYVFWSANVTKYGKDYDQFALVENSFYPYIRLTKKRGANHLPCGMGSAPASDGWFTSLAKEERESRFPKIAYGFAAIFLANLCYDTDQSDYVLQEDIEELTNNYYYKYLNVYLHKHSGLKYSHISEIQKELNFILEHESVIKNLWDRSSPLKRYPELYDYAQKAEAYYERFLEFRKKCIIDLGEKHVSNEKRMTTRNEAYFAGIEDKIMRALDEAVATIDVCVAWFTNQNLREKLLEKSNDGVEVRVIIYKDGVNKSAGVDLSGLNHKEYRGERGGILHDKFCVIDNVHTICGSYNWTKNAENKNDEDATFHFEDYRLASLFTKRFNEMWRRDQNKKKLVDY